MAKKNAKKKTASAKKNRVEQDYSVSITTSPTWSVTEGTPSRSADAMLAAASGFEAAAAALRASAGLVSDFNRKIDAIRRRVAEGGEVSKIDAFA